MVTFSANFSDSDSEESISTSTPSHDQYKLHEPYEQYEQYEQKTDNININLITEEVDGWPRTDTTSVLTDPTINLAEPWSMPADWPDAMSMLTFFACALLRDEMGMWPLGVWGVYWGVHWVVGGFRAETWAVVLRGVFWGFVFVLFFHPFLSFLSGLID